MNQALINVKFDRLACSTSLFVLCQSARVNCSPESLLEIVSN
jgi:hypothetical protein